MSVDSAESESPLPLPAGPAHADECEAKRFQLSNLMRQPDK